MATFKDLKSGDEVWIKKPSNIYGKVIGPRPGDAGLPPEEQLWTVEVLPYTQYLHPEHFELVHPPKDPNEPHEYTSKEWAEEFSIFNAAASRYLADNNDKAAMIEANEALRKLGFVKNK
jgi:hypothetical protein